MLFRGNYPVLRFTKVLPKMEDWETRLLVKKYATELLKHSRCYVDIAATLKFLVTYSLSFHAHLCFILFYFFANLNLVLSFLLLQHEVRGVCAFR